jgi:thiamine kinase-like enzyme
MDYRIIFQPLFDKIGFEPTDVFREGPRFYIVGGGYGGQEAIFKADVEIGPKQMRKARFRTQREAVFLEYADLGNHIPKFFCKGARKGFQWFLREQVIGESQEKGKSTFLMKDDFFTEENLRGLLRFLTALHRLSRKSLPQFEVYFPCYTLANYMNLIWPDRGQLLGDELSTAASAVLTKGHKLFNSHQTAITHHELYGPHILLSPGRFAVIDWENVGWGNIAYDFVTVWIRSFAHPDFQAELFKKFRASQRDKESFDQLFRIEMILQGVGNIRYFKHAKLAEEKAIADEISTFLRENIARLVRSDRSRPR